MKPRKSVTTARIVLGVLFVAGPLTAAFHLAPEPTLAPRAAAFMNALTRSGYMLPLLWTTEIAAGLLLLSGVFAPLGLLILAPVLVNIAAFHFFLAPNAAVPAVLACALETFLAWQYRDEFAPLFRSPASRRESRSRETSRAVA